MLETVFREHLIGGLLSVVILAIVVPVFWRGAPWQAPIAFILMWMPTVVMVSIVLLVIQYW